MAGEGTRIGADLRDAMEDGYRRLEAALLHQTLVGVHAAGLDLAGVADEAAQERVGAETIKLGLALLQRADKLRSGADAEGEGGAEDLDAALRRELDALARRRARTCS
jgi:hypothetical protein